MTGTFSCYFFSSNIKSRNNPSGSFKSDVMTSNLRQSPLRMSTSYFKSTYRKVQKSTYFSISARFTAKFELALILTQENAFFGALILKQTERASVLLQNATRDF